MAWRYGLSVIPSVLPSFLHLERAIKYTYPHSFPPSLPPSLPTLQGYRVHFLGWSGRWDEWVEAGSERIQPCYSTVRSILSSLPPPPSVEMILTPPSLPPSLPPSGPQLASLVANRRCGGSKVSRLSRPMAEWGGGGGGERGRVGEV